MPALALVADQRGDEVLHRDGTTCGNVVEVQGAHASTVHAVPERDGGHADWWAIEQGVNRVGRVRVAAVRLDVEIGAGTCLSLRPGRASSARGGTTVVPDPVLGGGLRLRPIEYIAVEVGRAVRGRALLVNKCANAINVVSERRVHQKFQVSVVAHVAEAIELIVAVVNVVAGHVQRRAGGELRDD